MSFSWSYLTRRFLFQNYRDYVAMTMIGSYVGGQFISYCASEDDNSFIRQHVYTDDESDMSYREKSNKTDGAVRRKLIFAYTEKIRNMRAENERAA